MDTGASDASNANSNANSEAIAQPSPFFNFGGPGWFNDVFEIDLKFNGERQTKTKGYMFQETLSLFGADETASGIIKVIPPLNHSVWHYGVTIKLETLIHFSESLRIVDMPVENEAITIAESEAISAPTDYPFEINLAKFKLLDSYDGEIMDIRHSLIVTVLRPWYTFNVARSYALAINNISPAPLDDNVDALPSFDTAEHPNVPKGHILKVTDCGGEITFDYQRSMYNIGDTLHGTISSKGVPQSLVSGRIKLYKIEKGDRDVYEKIVAIKSIIVPSSNSNGDTANEQKAIEDDQSAKLGVRTKPLQEDETFEVDFTIDSDGDATISPTFIELNEPSDTINVHYYLRLEFSNAEGLSFWNTHEVILYRSHLSGVTAVDV